MRPDVTSLRHWLRDTWDGNRAFTTASMAALLGLLALATAAGAFGGPAAAAEPVPTVTIPGGFGEPVPTSGVPAPRVSASPSPAPSGVESPAPSPIRRSSRSLAIRRTVRVAGALIGRPVPLP